MQFHYFLFWNLHEIIIIVSLFCLSMTGNTVRKGTNGLSAENTCIQIMMFFLDIGRFGNTQWCLAVETTNDFSGPFCR